MKESPQGLWVLNFIIGDKRYPGQVIIHQERMYLVMQHNMHLFDANYKNTPLRIFERHDGKRMVFGITPGNLESVTQQVSFWNKRVVLTLRDVPECARTIALDRGMMSVQNLHDAIVRFMTLRAAKDGMPS